MSAMKAELNVSWTVCHFLTGQCVISSGASIPCASAPALGFGAQGCRLLSGSHDTDLVCQFVEWAWRQTLLVVINDVLSVRTSTRWASRSVRKCFRPRKTDFISRQFMCHERWRSLHRPCAKRPLMITPQPMRDASVVSVTQQQEAPSREAWDKNQGTFYITKVQRLVCVVLIMQSGFPLMENPFFLSLQLHHVQKTKQPQRWRILLPPSSSRDLSIEMLPLAF